MGKGPRRLLAPLDHPGLVAAGGAVLVVAVRIAQLPLPLGLLLGVGVTLTLTEWRRRLRGREHRRRHLRLDTRLEAIDARCDQLALQAAELSRQAARTLAGEQQLERLTEVQMLCDRLGTLPAWTERHAEALEAGRGVPMPLQPLRAQLRDEERAQRREPAGPLREARQRLVAQLQANLAAAEQGLDEREARVLSLATGLERLAGDLQRLQGLLEGLNSTETASIPRLQAAIQTIARDLDAIEAMGREPLG